MNRFYFLLFAFILFGSSFSHAAAEVITDFDVTYTINADATVVAKETISYDFQDANRHGFFRIIKNRHPQGASSWYKNRIIDVNVKRVLRDGTPETFEITSNVNDIEIKVGNPDSTVSGKHVYQIEYELIGALSYGPLGSEFYWNATGNDWSVDILHTSVSVYSEALTGTTSCYVGTVGSTRSCDSTLVNTGVSQFNQSQIPPGGGLTIAAALDPTRVAVVNSERLSFLMLGFIMVPIWALILSIWLYRVRTSAYRPQPVVAQYEPYADYLPVYTGVLLDGQLDARDITAGILYLAQQGYIKITKTTKTVLLFISVPDYTISLLKPIPDTLGEFLPNLSRLLFSAETTAGTSIALSSLMSHRSENSAILSKLQSDVRIDLQTKGFRDATTAPYRTQVIWFIAAAGIIFAPFWLIEDGFVFWIIVLFCTTFLALCAFIPRITAKGYEARNHVEGFKLFLSVTDTERFAFHNAPEKSPELFMEYLPYAIALGVETQWAKVFEGITIPNPDWYDGGTFSTFNAAALTSDLGAFSTSFSSSSGTSGSSGGGSSGGGGGGGGGGSW